MSPTENTGLDQSSVFIWTKVKKLFNFGSTGCINLALYYLLNDTKNVTFGSKLTEKLGDGTNLKHHIVYNLDGSITHFHPSPHQPLDMFIVVLRTILGLLKKLQYQMQLVEQKKKIFIYYRWNKTIQKNFQVKLCGEQERLLQTMRNKRHLAF